MRLSRANLEPMFLVSEDEGIGVRSATTAAMSRRQARSRTPCRANLELMFLVSTGEESPGSLNSKFAWETQVPVRVRTVPQKRRILCSQACLEERHAGTLEIRRRIIELLSDCVSKSENKRDTHRRKKVKPSDCATAR